MSGEVQVSGTGVSFYVGADRIERAAERLDEAVRVAALGGDHVWTVIVSHLIVDPAELTSPDLTLDAESMVGAYAGCFVCEQAFEPRLVRRRCPGEPK